MPKKNIFQVYFGKIPRPLRNKYVLTAAAFGVWMLFFDRHDVFTQLHLQNTLEDMKDKTAQFDERIEEVTKESQELSASDESMERFAREKYLMKKDDEEVFVIERKD